MKPLDYADIVSRCYDIFDTVAKDKCGPYRRSPCSIGLRAEDIRLKTHYFEKYERMDNNGFSLSIHSTFYGYDENDMDMQKWMSEITNDLKTELYPNISTIEDYVDHLEREGADITPEIRKEIIFYLGEDFSPWMIGRPYVKGKYIMYESTWKPPLRQAMLVDLFRSTELDILGLSYPKMYTIYIPLINVRNGFDPTGTIYFDVWEKVEDPIRTAVVEHDLAQLDETWDKQFIKAKELDKKGSKHNITVDRYMRLREHTQADYIHQGRREVGVEIWGDKMNKLEQSAQLDVEEFELVSSLVKDYDFDIHFSTVGPNPKRIRDEVTLDEIAEILNVG